MPVDPLGAELKQLNDRIYSLERRGTYPSAAADATWQVVSSFTNSWTNYPTGGWPTAAYRVDSEGWVTMRGLLSGGTSGNSAFTLPTAYRPNVAQTLHANAADGAGYVFIGTDGTVCPFGLSLSHFSLGQIMFPLWGRGNLRYQKISVPAYISDPYLRHVRLVLRRSMMWELVGVSGAVTLGVTASLNGSGPDYGDIFTATLADLTQIRFDIRDNVFYPAASSGTNVVVLGGTRWPDVSIEDSYTSLTLLNSWTNYGYGGSNYFAPASYYKDTNGYVHLRGLIRNGSSATAQIATLPAGFRPGGRTMFTTSGQAAAVGLEVNSTGQVLPRNANDRTYLSLAGISFLAEN